jgi:lipopolysaccharide transport system ATP-binding protein
MNDYAIVVNNISKRYRIGIKDEMHDNFVGAALGLIKKPLANYRKFRSLYRFDESSVAGSQLSGNSETDIIWALRNISMTVKKEEVVGIIGQNGAGKSTLLKILSRVTHPTDGFAEIRGRVSSLLEVGTGFHPELTGRDNVYLNGTILGMTRQEIDRKYEQIVEFSGVEKFIETPVKRYSSGMKVRLAFAVAAHMEPDILIVDEVLAVGDLEFQKKCLGNMKSTVSEGRTILFVSHNMPAVSSLCTRGILISNGQIAYDGATDEAIDRYISSSNTEISRSIAERTDREGNGEVRVVDFWAENGKGERISTISCSDKPAFNIAYRGAINHKKLQFVVSVYDDYNQRLLRFDSAINFEYNDKWPRYGHARCALTDRIGLKPGQYKTHFAVFVDKILADYVVDAVRLDIVEADFFGSGKLYKAWPKFLVGNQWSIDSSTVV